MARRSRHHALHPREGSPNPKGLYGIEKFTYVPEQNCYSVRKASH